MKASKTSSATMLALLAGLVGNAFMAGAVFAITAQTPHALFQVLQAG